MVTDSNSEYQEKVYEEVVRVLDGREHLEWNDLPKLEVTTKCIKESLRLHPAVPYIERETVEDCSINAQILPKGTRIAIHIWLLHHNPHIWENPDEFNPERFNPDNQVKLDPFQFVPFAAGPRNCIGQNFAMNEMKTTICKIIKKFKLSVDANKKVRRLPVVTMHAEGGMFLNVTLRK
ncbi:ultra-long-chain fatty acid omega-hydroxylase-like [Physella acuta]|uniref:ultra-long-chain fatty acid omega-hydroxylase-like n=1 Tax=Physella acuta TaxID=109671 RepID=UPI0027DCEA85|nr:ultra-long-chain fatty acid omega-hydroxylase-like [Physella acuta]